MFLFHYFVIYKTATKNEIKETSIQYILRKIITEDLVITGCHSILVDEFVSQEQKSKTIESNGDIYITDNKYRLPVWLDDRASVYNPEEVLTIYHIALENNDYYMNYGIYANGLLVESCSKCQLIESTDMTLM